MKKSILRLKNQNFEEDQKSQFKPFYYLLSNNRLFPAFPFLFILYCKNPFEYEGGYFVGNFAFNKPVSFQVTIRISGEPSGNSSDLVFSPGETEKEYSVYVLFNQTYILRFRSDENGRDCESEPVTVSPGHSTPVPRVTWNWDTSECE